MTQLDPTFQCTYQRILYNIHINLYCTSLSQMHLINLQLLLHIIQFSSLLTYGLFQTLHLFTYFFIFCVLHISSANNLLQKTKQGAHAGSISCHALLCKIGNSILFYSILLVLSHQGHVRRLKPVNTGSHKHTWRMRKKIPDPVINHIRILMLDSQALQFNTFYSFHYSIVTLLFVKELYVNQSVYHIILLEKTALHFRLHTMPSFKCKKFIILSSLRGQMCRFSPTQPIIYYSQQLRRPNVLFFTHVVHLERNSPHFQEIASPIF